MNSFGNYINKIRESKNMTLDDVATKSEISSAQLSRIENGKRGIPKPSTLKKLSVALDVEYNELMFAAGYVQNNEPSTEIEKLFNGNEKLNKWYHELKYYKEEDVELLYDLWLSIEKRLR
ncbi:XRE family transcriptional regulator [Butyricicoccus sp. 1XD8-22]|nr:XRE family transcriptional regulator [Butyricicoccus sp. 1XD8-22]